MSNIELNLLRKFYQLTIFLVQHTNPKIFGNWLSLARFCKVKQERSRDLHMPGSHQSNLNKTRDLLTDWHGKTMIGLRPDENFNTSGEGGLPPKTEVHDTELHQQVARIAHCISLSMSILIPGVSIIYFWRISILMKRNSSTFMNKKTPILYKKKTLLSLFYKKKTIYLWLISNLF